MSETKRSRVRCAECKYVRVDEGMSEKNWIAYECGNHDSDFHKALLNVTSKGVKQNWITWRGCEQGRARA